MSRFIETIRLENGRLPDLAYHQARVNRSLKEVLEIKQEINLYRSLINYKLPVKGLYKIRIVYDKAIWSVEISPYSIRAIRQMKIVYNHSISYPYKFEDRKELDDLFNKRGECDDIIIVTNNEITDSSYANLLFKKKDKWFTPASYLLNGTMRQQLLDRKIIFEKSITVDDLERYEKIKLVNAMMQLDGPEIDVSHIVK